MLRQIPGKLKEVAIRHKTSIDAAAQVLILVMVLVAALNGGVKLAQTQSSLPPLGILWVWCYAGIHTAVLLLGRSLARRLGTNLPMNMQ
ncbi:MAG: hypothetical protein U0903_17110 [Planctomycetales bacterium]